MWRNIKQAALDASQGGGMPSVRHAEDGLTWPALLGLLLPTLWVAHALAFFAHEYAHSFTAWVLGWKANPLALTYGHPSLKVFLIQYGIDQNVDELPIFRSHHGAQAALISAAGMVLGNALITLPLSRWAYLRARHSASRGWAMLWYWTTVASVGNLIDYVPIRVFTNGTDLSSDMYPVELGFGWSPWTLLLAFGAPTALVLAWFLMRFEPEALAFLCPASRPKRACLAVLTAFALFDFYGAAGWTGGGPVSHTLSVVSVCVIAPLAAVLGIVLVASAREATAKT